MENYFGCVGGLQAQKFAESFAVHATFWLVPCSLKRKLNGFPEIEKQRNNLKALLTLKSSQKLRAKAL